MKSFSFLQSRCYINCFIIICMTWSVVQYFMVTELFQCTCWEAEMRNTFSGHISVQVLTKQCVKYNLLRDNVPWHTTNTAQEWPDTHDEEPRWRLQAEKHLSDNKVDALLLILLKCWWSLWLLNTFPLLHAHWKSVKLSQKPSLSAFKELKASTRPPMITLQVNICEKCRDKSDPRRPLRSVVLVLWHCARCTDSESCSSKNTQRGDWSLVSMFSETHTAPAGWMETVHTHHQRVWLTWLTQESSPLVSFAVWCTVHVAKPLMQYITKTVIR